MKRLRWGAVCTLVAVLVVGAANQMYQLEIYEWLRLRDGTLISWGTSDDFYARYDGVSAVELRAGDGSELATVDAAGVAVTGDMDIGGQIEAGTGNHTLTTPAGLIDGAKIAPGTVTGAQVYSSGASPGDLFIVDASNAWTILGIGGHGTLDGTGALTIQTYTGATAVDAGIEGLVPDSTAGAANRFLCVDGSWSVPGIGAVTGPGASTDRAIAVWDGTDGDKVQNSLVLISTSGGVVIPGTLTMGSGAHVLTNSAGLLDGGKIQSGTVTSTQLSITGVTAGSYTVPAITVDSTGRLTAAANGSLGLIDLDDGATAYTGAAGYPLVVSSTEDGWEFASVLAVSVLPELVGDSGSGGTAGIVPAPGVGDAAAGKYLAADGTWATPAGSGNVAGPGTSTDNALALFDGTGGQTLQDSSITSSDGSSLVIPGTITAGSGANVLTNSTGLLDGGKLQAGSVGISALDIAGGTAATTADDADLIVLYDDSATANRVMTRAHFLSGLGDDMGDVDTEAELEAALTDVTDILTNNDTFYQYFIDSAGTAGQVWTSDGNGRGGWAAATGGGASAFTDLTDAPSAYTGQAGKVVAVNSGETALEFIAGGGGASAFTDLSDAPSAYTSQGGKYVRVNVGETGLEFASAPGGDNMGAVDTEAELESALTDTSDVMTDNDATYRPILLTATGATFRTSDGADGPTQIETSTYKNVFYTVDFDKDTDEYAHWAGLSLPYDYKSGTALKVRVNWTAIAGTSGNVRWCVGATAFANDDAFDVPPGTPVVLSDTFIATGDLHSTSYGDLTIGGTPAAGELLAIYVYRHASDVNDTFDADANLLNIEIAYQAEFVTP
jgi:hypothetical protein